MRRALLRGWIRLGDLHRAALSVLYAAIGPQAAYRLSDAAAAAIYALLEPLRGRIESQCGAALARTHSPAAIRAIARRSFIHRVRNLTDLLIARRSLVGRRAVRFDATLSPEQRRWLLDMQARRRPMILVSAHFGSFDLLAILLGRCGVRATIAYRGHENEAFDRQRRAVRELGGCELVALGSAAARFAQVLEQGGTAALLADHAADRRGVVVDFFGRSVCASRSVGLLATRYGATVVVAALLRRGPFEFALKLERVIEPSGACGAADVTRTVVEAIESLIRRDPAQYLWGRTAWAAASADPDAQLSPAESAMASPRPIDEPTIPS